MEISLEQLLLSRDERANLQQELLAKFLDKTLLCLTVVMPGKVKRNANSLIVAEAATQALDKTFENKILHREIKDAVTGYEAYYVVDMDNVEAKKTVCNIEDTHPLGRLFDIDVFGDNGLPLSRTALGFEPRRCLICNQEARYCMRNFTHTQQEIQAKINQMISTYVRH